MDLYIDFDLRFLLDLERGLDTSLLMILKRL